MVNDLRGAAVEVCMPARPGLIPLLRAITSDLAGRADFDLDSIADLRMAVDEVAATLVGRTTPDRELRARFLVAADRLEVSVSAHVGRAAALDTGSFGWRVLQTLVDELEQYTHLDPAADPSGGPAQVPPGQLGIRLVKKGPAG